MIWIKRGFFLAALGVLVYLFLPLLGEIEAAAGLLLTANWIWLPLILSVYLTSYTFLTWLNSMALKPFEGTIHFPKLAAVLTSIAFIEVAVPSGGVSGVALRARLLSKHGQFSFEGSTFSLILEMIYSAFRPGLFGAFGSCLSPPGRAYQCFPTIWSCFWGCPGRVCRLERLASHSQFRIKPEDRIQGNRALEWYWGYVFSG
jgi:hypothetical protein